MDFCVQGPLKINLTLRITGKREDGYHNLASGVIKIPSGDLMCFKEKPLSNLYAEDSVVTHNFPIHGENVLHKALGVLRGKKNDLPFLDVAIQKIIPPGSGVGGGSGNLAAFLKWIERKYGFTLSLEEVTNLGADVPFLYSPHRCAFLTGIGEKMEPIILDKNYTALVAFPLWCSDTAKAYAKLDEELALGNISWSSETSAREEALNIFQKLRQGKTVGFLPNDFFCTFQEKDSYKKFFHIAEVHGALGWGVSGSGSSLYALFPSRGRGEEIMHGFLKKIDSFSWISRLLYYDV